MLTHFCQMGISTSDWVDDSERFLLGYFDAIHDSPSHIYHSALPLLPSSSWVRKCYGADASGKVRVVMGPPDKWDACSRTIFFQHSITASAHWGDTIAIGHGRDVVFFDVITGIRTSVLCGHTDGIYRLAFSQDGTLLLSGSYDKTVRVWDVQTGGVIRTFDHDHLTYSAASISSDGALVALGAKDGTIRLCDVRTGECNSIEMYHEDVTAIEFSPINSRRFTSSSKGRVVRQWDIDGDQVGRSYNEADDVWNFAWTRDGTRFVSCGGKVATVRDAESGAVVVKLHAPDNSWPLSIGCFSPDGRLVACAAGITIWVWDITVSEGRLVGHLLGHSNRIGFLAFSSSLISGGFDGSVKFWKSGSFSMDLTTSDQTAARGPFPEIRSIKLFTEEGMVVTSDSGGVVKVWDVMTGRCKSSFLTPANGKGIRDTHLTRNTLIIVWCPNTGRDRNTAMEYHIWDVYKGQLLRKFHSYPPVLKLKISGDGSKVFRLEYNHIVAVSMQTGEEVGRVELERRVEKLFVRGFKVWVDDRPHRIWDFGGPGAPALEEFPDRPHLRLVNSGRGYGIRPCWMEDIVTKRRVFCSLERYLECGKKLEWDGRYLFNCSRSGEDIMIIDFDPVCT